MSERRADPRRTTEPRGDDPLGAAVWVRPFRDDDGPALRTLVGDVLAEFGLSSDPSGTDGDIEDVERHYRGAGGELWVVEDGHGRLVGSCGVWIDPADARVCELRKMYLQDDQRGRGLGRRLLDGALAHARAAGCGRMELETASAMDAAIGLYRSAGFVELTDAPRASRCDRRFALDLTGPA